MTQAKIDVADVLTVALNLPADGTNDGECFYRIPTYVENEWGDMVPDEDNLTDEPHCIAANILVMLGLPLPRKENNGAMFCQVVGDEAFSGIQNFQVEDIYKERLTDEACILIDKMQAIADGRDNGDANNYWAEAIEYALADR